VSCRVISWAIYVSLQGVAQLISQSPPPPFVGYHYENIYIFTLKHIPAQRFILDQNDFICGIGTNEEKIYD
jgi:hypothetical protein